MYEWKCGQPIVRICGRCWLRAFRCVMQNLILLLRKEGIASRSRSGSVVRCDYMRLSVCERARARVGVGVSFCRHSPLNLIWCVYFMDTSDFYKRAATNSDGAAMQRISNLCLCEPEHFECTAFSLAIAQKIFQKINDCWTICNRLSKTVESLVKFKATSRTQYFRTIMSLLCCGPRDVKDAKGVRQEIYELWLFFVS